MRGGMNGMGIEYLEKNQLREADMLIFQYSERNG